MKKTFNVTDLTKKVLGTEDVNSDIFISERKRISRHIKDMHKSLGLPKQKFEAPIEQLDAYVKLIKELLYNAENDEPLDLLTKKMWKDKELRDALDSDNLKRLLTIFAEAEKLKLTDDELVLYEKWFQDQVSDEYYTQSQKRLIEIMNLIKDDFSFFDNLNSIEAKLEYQEQYMNDIRNISLLYRQQAEEQLLFESCFLEVISNYENMEKKKIYTLVDFLTLPPHIQDEIRSLMEQKRSGKSS